MRRILSVALVGLVAVMVVVGLPAAPAQACSCASTSVPDQYEQADAVFAGTLVSRQVTHPDGLLSSSTDPALHVFAVDSVYKGEVH